MNVLALSLLPPEEADPIGSLHTTIIKLHTVVKCALIDERLYTKLLFDVQDRLYYSLSSTLPIFLPFFEGDDGAADTYDGPKIQDWTGEGSKNYVYLDEILSVVQQ